MRALFHRFRQARNTGTGHGIAFDETRGEVCDTACRANAAYDRARTSALTLR
ncbi:hypothetical protein OIE66_07010 [Nonomuraea sp. NBC_01738]|uniref:hypothetical protein n=1 Tax=Nonomuraea sp. NBC_01738 TaxID=2976003 RepID=UPI002E0DBB47|nr:hypothetical protein OIE66_07010 [Nonomuraea sp. NBC_01738]